MTEKEKFVKTILVRIREDMNEEVRQYCSSNGLTMSDFIREAISEKLEREQSINEVQK